MNVAEMHLRQAEAELRAAKGHLLGAEDTQALVEAIMVVEILANKYAETPGAEKDAATEAKAKYRALRHHPNSVSENILRQHD